MINMTSSTSMTSISGVVLMSIMTSGSGELLEPTFMLMRGSSCCRGHPPRTGGSVMNPTLAMPARWHA